MTHVTVGVCKETAPGEHRVALVPASVGPVNALGARVAVESGAGAAAGFTDTAYEEAGAVVVGRAQVMDRAGLLVAVGAPGAGAGDRLRRGQTVLGLLDPLRNPLSMRYLADHAIDAISLDLIGSTPDPSGPAGREPADAAASQDRITGYEAVLTAAGHCGRCLPPLVAGETVRALVVGAGAAGLQAMSTARALGAAVEGCDTDPHSADRVRAAGARFRDLSAARSPAAMRPALTRALPRFDLVVVTAPQSPAAEPGILVTAEAAASMSAGCVVVDTTVGPGGGAVELAEPDTAVTVPPGVTIAGASGVAPRLAATASRAYARHLTAFFARLIRDGRVTVDFSDPLQDAAVVTHDGTVRTDAVWRRILDITAVAGLP